jgi:hypothetical protein
MTGGNGGDGVVDLPRQWLYVLKSDIEPRPSSPRQERTKEFSREEREAVFK